MNKSNQIIVLLVGVMISLLISISLGGAAISIADIMRVFRYQLFGIQLSAEMDPIVPGIIWNIRLPRVLLSFVVGAALAVSGSVMQSVLKNPLASSYTLGVSSGAALGTVIVIIFGLSSSVMGMFLMPFAAITFGMGTIFLAIIFASRMSHHLDTHAIILVGMIVSVFINALMMTLASRSPQFAQQISAWQLGSLALRGWTVLGIVFISSLLLIFWLARFSKELDVLTFGDEQASAIGVDVKKTKWNLLITSAMLTGISVAFVGVIGFVDLIAPHVIRRFFGSSHRYVIPLSAIFGGLFMVVADLIARTVIAPSELPIGSVTALFGAPFFVYLFLNHARKQGG